MKNYVLHFVRHGQTDSNGKGEYLGRRTDSELSLDGIRELIALREDYEYPAVELVYSSPLHRCLQTADLIYPDRRIMLVDELAEMDFGDYEGKTFDELQSRPDFRRWLTDSRTQSPPNGETGEVFLQRIQAAVAAILEHMMQNEIFEAAVVTHGGVIATLMTTLGIPQQPMQFWKCSGGRGFTCFINPQLWQRDHLFEVAGILPHGASAAFRPDWGKDQG